MKFGVEVFWLKILSTTVAPVEAPMALTMLDPLLGPSPMSPNPSGLVPPEGTSTANLRSNGVQTVDQDGDLL